MSTEETKVSTEATESAPVESQPVAPTVRKSGMNLGKKATIEAQLTAVVDILGNLSEGVKALTTRIEAVETARVSEPTPVYAPFADPDPSTQAVKNDILRVADPGGELKIKNQYTPSTSGVRFPELGYCKHAADEILGAEHGFEYRVEGGYIAAGVDAFMFTIIVPERFTLPEDHRSKVISVADGLNGVRDWSIRVRQQLAKDMKDKVK